MVGWLALSRYDWQVAKDLLGPSVVALASFAVVSAVDILFYLVDLSVLSGISVWVVVKLMLFKLPAVMVVFAPVCGLFAIMLAMIRMNKDNEWMVIRLAGVSTGVMIRPFLWWGGLTWLGCYALNESVIPLLNYKANQLIQREIERKPPPQIAEKVVFAGSENRFFYIQRINRDTGVMQGMTILDQSQPSLRVVMAQTGRWGNQKWQLFNGSLFDFSPQGQLLSTTQFNTLSIRIVQSLGVFYQDNKAPSEMDSAELSQQIKTLASRGLPTHALKVERGLKQSIPAACMVLAMVGIACGISFLGNPKEWRDIMKAVGAAVVMVLLYYVILAILRSLGKSGAISPGIAAWGSPVLIACIATTAILYHIRR